MEHAAGSWLSVRICPASLVSVPIVTDTLPVGWTLSSALRKGKGPLTTFLLTAPGVVGSRTRRRRPTTVGQSD